jgi:hypothetical protein
MTGNLALIRPAIVGDLRTISIAHALRAANETPPDRPMTFSRGNGRPKALA